MKGKFGLRLCGIFGLERGRWIGEGSYLQSVIVSIHVALVQRYFQANTTVKLYALISIFCVPAPL